MGRSVMSSDKGNGLVMECVKRLGSVRDSIERYTARAHSSYERYCREVAASRTSDVEAESTVRLDSSCEDEDVPSASEVLSLLTMLDALVDECSEETDQSIMDSEVLRATVHLVVELGTAGVIRTEAVQLLKCIMVGVGEESTTHVRLTKYLLTTCNLPSMIAETMSKLSAEGTVGREHEIRAAMLMLSEMLDECVIIRRELKRSKAWCKYVQDTWRSEAERRHRDTECQVSGDSTIEEKRRKDQEYTAARWDDFRLLLSYSV